jgi:GT2 family glycosyltransferase
MQLSVIILSYNVRYFLEQCVASVQEALSGIESEIIVVDNNSSDDSCTMMKIRFPNIKLIENATNLGFPKGNNIGVAHAKGDYICILNPDTVVAEDTFSKILTFAEKQKNIGIIGCKLIDGTGNFLPESKRSIPTPWVAFTKIMGLYHFFPKSTLFNQYYFQKLSENETGKVAILVGAFMVMKRELYQEIGGFDENCFMYSDDIDLSYMALKKGKENYYFHETTVILYKGESTLKDGLYMKRFQEAMNFFYKKHFKSFVIFSIFMKIGILFFAFTKYFQGKSKLISKPEQYFLVSNNDKLKEKLEHLLNAPVQFWKTKKAFSENTEIILDQDYLGFSKCIDFMESNKNKQLTFKILPKNTTFIIGSNSNRSRGEVIEMDLL